METTTLPASGSRRARTVALALSQGVARTTSSATAAPALSGTSQCKVAVGPAAAQILYDGMQPAPRRVRTDRDLVSGISQAECQPPAGRSGAPEDSDVHVPTFA